MSRGQFYLICAGLVFFGGAACCAAQNTPPRGIDAGRLAAAGLRVLEGRYVQLVTDLPSRPAIDELPAVFDAAVPEWAKYFELGSAKVRGRWLAFLIQDRERFASLGLLPAENTLLVNGYARGYELWLLEQPSDYYRRHLLLHEGTHAFMQTQLGGCGAPWYMEGIAERLGTHAWRGGRLTLGVIPASRGEAPMWGRIKLVREAVAAGKPWALERVLAVDNSRVLATEHYAWTWALATLLDAHPQFQARFRALKQHAADPKFMDKFRAAFAKDWGELSAEWEAYIAELDYGYDLPRMAMVHRPAMPVRDAPPSAKIVTDRGWQSTGWLLKAGQSYRITASGRFQIANDGKPWPCEPGGVTLEYHDGKPVGAVLGALRPITPGQSPGLQKGAANVDGSFARPVLIGAERTFTPSYDAVLYVRVNDSAAKLGDNVGDITLKVDATNNN